MHAVFRRLERRNYSRTPHLRALCAPLIDPDRQPSHYLRVLALVVAATGVQGNPVIAALLNLSLPWGLFFAYRLDRLRIELAERAPVWLEVWYELEALGSLANFAKLNPGTTFPTFALEETEPVLEARAIAHPLLGETGKVRNDFSFAHLGDIVILTGSNMAGKSTFLKALGANLALAYAGGVVDAEALTTRFLRIFTCIKVSDSVTGGISYFYAEVQRLKALLVALEMPHPLPLFFVIDEILRGTNNRERLLGSRAYIAALSHQRGVGLIATHDLELAKLADSFPNIRNFHFRDEVRDDKMVFDFRLRAGPSPTTNALKIMRSAGLPVDEHE
jgi:DNA mismatch repair ATPase MutS